MEDNFYKQREFANIMNSIEDEYNNLIQKQSILDHEKERLSKLCSHDFVLKSNAYNLRLHCLCCDMELMHLNNDTTVIDIDNKFGKAYISGLNFIYYNMVYKNVCEYMSKYFRIIVNNYDNKKDIEEVLNEELKNYANNYLSGRKLK